MVDLIAWIRNLEVFFRDFEFLCWIIGFFDGLGDGMGNILLIGHSVVFIGGRRV